MFNLRHIISISLFTLASSSWAAEDPAAPPEPGESTQTGSVMEQKAPTIPDQPTTEEEDSRNIPQPEVNIIHKKNMRIEEYRINGRVRYVKIIPNKGKPYYLVDKDGDGELETRHSDLDGIPPINEWILMKW